MRRIAKRVLVVAVLVVLALWVGNSSALMRPPEEQQPQLLAHRGVHQVYVGGQRGRDACHAQPIAPPAHGFIENTIPSMRAAFDAGAKVVELDVHLTPDGVFAVYHDWRLECQTDGTGVTEKQPFALLSGLDVGYGYSADGQSFPLRGTGVGLMPSLRKVFAARLGGQYLINFKSRRAEEGGHLAKMLEDPEVKAQVFGVYGGSAPTNAALEAVPGLRGFDRPALKACYRDYLLTGWAGRVPAGCRDRILLVPVNLGPLLWGWPHRFTVRMKRAGTSVILAGAYDGSGFASGIDDAETLSRVPDRFDGYIWTDRAEVIGPRLARR